MEPPVVEPTTSPTVEPRVAATAGPSPGRDRSGEGEGQYRHERHTLRIFLITASSSLRGSEVSVRRMGQAASHGPGIPYASLEKYHKGS
jgi:hypothetical protein